MFWIGQDKPTGYHQLRLDVYQVAQLGKSTINAVMNAVQRYNHL